jgi:hypothetical protein
MKGENNMKPRKFEIGGVLYYNASAVAAKTGFAESTVRTYASRRNIGIDLANKRLFSEADIQAMIDYPDGRTTRWKKN